jgi:hypothetical protein
MELGQVVLSIKNLYTEYNENVKKKVRKLTFLILKILNKMVADPEREKEGTASLLRKLEWLKGHLLGMAKVKY